MADVHNATSGVNQEELVDLANQIVNITDEMAEDIKFNKDKVVEAVDTVWFGKAAEKFKNKVVEDSDTMCEVIKENGKEMSDQIHNIGSNIEDYDDEIAQSID